MKKILISFLAFISSFFTTKTNLISGFTNSQISPTPNPIYSPIPLMLPTPAPTPSPKPLTFNELNALYGPCVNLPTLMYHHIQSEESAKSNKQTSLTVYTDFFAKQMQYLKDKNYNVLGAEDLVNFFTTSTKIHPKSVILTFDDAYEDFYTDAFPILRNLGFKAIIFTPTGLVNNSGYLNWDQIFEMKNNNIFFANHTWSHKNVLVAKNIMENEIKTADEQLTERNLNNPKVFAYPYGIDNIASEDYLNSLGYQFAFTTKPGTILCQKKKFDLPRVRVGNRPLSSYGF